MLEYVEEWFDHVHWTFYFVTLFLIFLILVFIHDVFIQKKHTIKHNFPIIGHLRYLLEKIGPELRQYIVANNREELPFNRRDRSWVYASSKMENNYHGFGTDQDQHAPGFIFINPSMFPYRLGVNHPNLKDKSFLPCAKVMGLYNKRRHPYRPYSAINVSGMSFGSLSANAVTALNKGALMSGCYHNTGEGGIARYHKFGADVMFHIGTGYFGCRTPDGEFSLEKLKETLANSPQIKTLEVKISQGAKPGKGGVLPASKITPEIAVIRGVPMGRDVISPAYHHVFNTVRGMVDFIEMLAQETGLPVGIKAAVGKMEMWEELAEMMLQENRGPDFITIDGGEGGTGAAPPAFTDHVALPFVYGFTSVYQVFAAKNITDRIVWIGSGKLGFPSSALMAFSMGVDIIHVARTAMMSIGCIQAQICHTNKCPAGVATQSKWLQAGLDPQLKSVRFYNYARTLRKEIIEISHACNYEHPCQMTMADVDVSMGDNNRTQKLYHVYGYRKEKVPFESMEALLNCPYLGGPKKLLA